MNKKVIRIVIVFVIIFFAGSIIITNIIYGKYMQPTQLSVDDWYKGKGYSIKFDKYEVYENDKLREAAIDKEQYDMCIGVMCEDRDLQALLVYATIKVDNVELMRTGKTAWYEGFMFEANDMWRNPNSRYLSQLFDNLNLSVDNYEDGGEYDVVFIAAINELQVTEKEFNNAKNWNYRIIWSQNPIVYVNLLK